jgi:hypothetical protein
LIINCITSEIYHIQVYEDALHYRWRAANFSLCSALRIFEQERILTVSHLLGHGASLFPISPEGAPRLITSYNLQGDAEDLFLTRIFTCSPFICLLRHAKGCWEPILIRILTGLTCIKCKLSRHIRFTIDLNCGHIYLFGWFVGCL